MALVSFVCMCLYFTAAVMIVDDDLLIAASDVDFSFHTWQVQRHILPCTCIHSSIYSTTTTFFDSNFLSGLLVLFLASMSLSLMVPLAMVTSTGREECPTPTLWCSLMLVFCTRTISGCLTKQFHKKFMR